MSAKGSTPRSTAKRVTRSSLLEELVPVAARSCGARRPSHSVEARAREPGDASPDRAPRWNRPQSGGARLKGLVRAALTGGDVGKLIALPTNWPKHFFGVRFSRGPRLGAR